MKTSLLRMCYQTGRKKNDWQVKEINLRGEKYD